MASFGEAQASYSRQPNFRSNVGESAIVDAKIAVRFNSTPARSMQLSLSVRIVESACKTRLNLPFEQMVSIAREAGYQAVCMRASAGGVDSPLPQLRDMRRLVEDSGLRVSMVTADSNVPLNNDRGPDSLRDINPSLDVADALGCDLIRVCLKRREDIPFARDSAIRAAERGIRLAHQCHTSSIFERVDDMLAVVGEIAQPNFGVIYEPANLLLCGQSYGLQTLARLRPHLMNVYLQNHCLNPKGADSLPTYCRGRVYFDHLAPWEAGGIDFHSVFAALRSIQYAGYCTVHQAQGITSKEDALAFAVRCAESVRGHSDTDVTS